MQTPNNETIISEASNNETQVPQQTLPVLVNSGSCIEDDRHLRWYLVSSAAGQEERLKRLFQHRIDQSSAYAVKNIQDVFLPIHTDGKPFVSCRLFVYGVESAIRQFMAQNYSSGHLLYDSAHGCPIVVSDAVMEDFRYLFEHYSNELIILEKPYQHFYSHIDKRTGKRVLNLRARVLDGPFAGRTGFIVRIKKNNCLAFRLSSTMCISLTHAWNYKLERIPDAHADYMSVASQMGRDVDYLIDFVQTAGFIEDYQNILQYILSTMKEQPSHQVLVNALEEMSALHPNDRRYSLLVRLVHTMPFENLAALTRIVHYIDTNKLKVEELQWANTYRMRPFLVPSTLQLKEGRKVALVEHAGFTEYVLPCPITQDKYDHSTDSILTQTHTYYAHVYAKKDGKRILLFANWDEFLTRYYAFEDRARMVQKYQIKQNCMPLYNLLDDNADSQLHVQKVLLYPIKTDKGIQSLEVQCVTKEIVPQGIQFNDTSSMLPLLKAFVNEVLALCQSINQSTHLHFWRTNLHTVWLCK